MKNVTNHAVYQFLTKFYGLNVTEHTAQAKAMKAANKATVIKLLATATKVALGAGTPTKDGTPTTKYYFEEVNLVAVATNDTQTVITIYPKADTAFWVNGEFTQAFVK